MTAQLKAHAGTVHAPAGRALSAVPLYGRYVIPPCPTLVYQGLSLLEIEVKPRLA